MSSDKASVVEYVDHPSKDDLQKAESDLPVHSELAAVLAKEKPRPWSRSMIKLYLIVFVAYLCSATNGFDSNTFGGASAMTSFEDYFSVHGGSKQGLIAASYVIGNMVGSLGAGQISDKWGRRYGMGIGSFICLVGAVFQAAAHNTNYLIGGRVVLGLGAVIAQTAGPAYVVEMSHPAYRGVMTGAYQANFFLGTIISTWIEFGLSYVPGNPDFQWRLPMGLQALPSILVLMFIWFIPESPRWYMGQGKDEKAREILTKYHSEGNMDSEIVRLQMKEMKEVIEVESGTDKRWWDIRGLLRTRSDRHRFFLVLCIAFFGQLDLPPTSYYFPLMVESAGVTNEHMVLMLNALQTPIMMIAALSGLRFIEKWGRRPTLMLSSTGMSFSVVVITVCTALTPTHPQAGVVGIAFLYVFLIVFAFVWTPMQSLYPVEVLSYNNRAKGLAVMNLFVNACGLFNTYLPPVAIANVGWRFYLFYASWDALGVIVIYFTFVETKGRNLEEIDTIFQSQHPVRASLEKQ
ncbi:general substrate transporter [Laetiporus sulphureus 93-53]|uniref:General substrate transporter n=1 Tax=Laetiporus sulphureus 93-53 TaxID=1314785 RepID=A0A165ICI8_9APHY|nr:general substrate transporter [Laetiporus sulphureus 93-53]KZT12891.1 general substrate transporter [Laetiporus sulphureus 93-53]